MKTTATATARTWSEFQRAVFADTEGGKGHTVVLARAGTGKTTTIVEALSYVPIKLSVLVVAFNKSIATEMAARCPKGVEVATLHSYGWRQVRGAFRGIRLDQDKSRTLCDDRFGNAPEARRRSAGLAKLVSLAKGTLVEGTDELDDLIDQFGIEPGDLPGERAAFIADAQWLLRECASRTDLADFDDMIWFPIKHALKCWAFDRVFVDETQDLNRCQVELALRACKPQGRICAVGDDRQAIYGFRGADAEAIPRLVKRLGAKVLPLSITYRCCKAVVEVAQQIVPDFTAHATNRQGVVGHCDSAKMLATVKPGDFILSRTNAPLMGACLALLRAGVPASIAGRDIGASLSSLVRKAEKAGHQTTEGLATWLDAWAAKEVARLTKRNPDADTSATYDKVACLVALSEGLDTTALVVTRIEGLFSDNSTEMRVVLSSTHKAKGLERDRVFLLADTYRKRPSTEEDNLWYVAVTRAKHELWLVSGEELN